MPIATDPLSLLFVACIVFAGVFLVLSVVLGAGHSQSSIHVHAGGHTFHLHTGGHTNHHAGLHSVTGHANGHGIGRTLAPNATPKPGMRLILPAQKGTPAIGPSWLGHFLEGINLTSLLAFLFFFGLLGYLLHNMAHARSLIAIILGILAGLGAAALMNMLYVRLLGNGVGQLDAASSDIEGRIATVSMAIRPDGIGEIIYMAEQGGRHSLGARSIDGSAIARDADVVIVGIAKGIALVQGWDDFLTQARAPIQIARGAE